MVASMNDGLTTTKAPTRGPKAIARVLDLMTMLASKHDGMSLADLSAAMAVPKSTFVDTLRGLCDLGYLSHRDGRYRLGRSNNDRPSVADGDRSRRHRAGRCG